MQYECQKLLSDCEFITVYLFGPDEVIVHGMYQPVNRENVTLTYKRFALTFNPHKTYYAGLETILSKFT